VGLSPKDEKNKNKKLFIYCVMSFWMKNSVMSFWMKISLWVFKIRGFDGGIQVSISWGTP
jgi:hypothetical protein